MITGAHSIIYSLNPEADRAFLRDVLGLPNVDVGSGWLIFGLPPAEVAVHPSNKNDVHEFYLMCDDIEALTTEMRKRRVACSQVTDQGWGLLTQVSLPGGGKLGIYQPRHARPNEMTIPAITNAGKANREVSQRASATGDQQGRAQALIGISLADRRMKATVVIRSQTISRGQASCCRSVERLKKETGINNRPQTGAWVAATQGGYLAPQRGCDRRFAVEFGSTVTPAWF